MMMFYRNRKGMVLVLALWVLSILAIFALSIGVGLRQKIGLVSRLENRDEVQAKLKEQGIPTAVHYPMPLHLQEAFKYLNHKKGNFPLSEKISDEIMSLPMNPYVTDEEIEYIGSHI